MAANGFYLIRGAADLDGDGNIDLVAQVGTDTTLQVVVLRGDGSGGFDAGTDVVAGPTALSFRLADVNGDGRPDLVAHHPTLQTVAVQTGQAGGSFAAPVHFPAPYAIHPQTELDDDGAAEDFYSLPSMGDLNGDGQIDIAVGDASGAIQVLFSTCGQPAGDLSVAVQESADPVTEGASFSYSVVVTNHGPATTSSAPSCTCRSTVPPGARDAAPARFTSATGASCVVADQHITCAVPALESTETLTLQATVSTLAGATLTFGAGVTSSNADPTPGNNSAFETTTVTAGRPQHRGHQHQRQRPRLAAAGDRRVERRQRRPSTRSSSTSPAAACTTIAPQSGLPTLTDAGRHRRHDAAGHGENEIDRQWAADDGSLHQRRQLHRPRHGPQPVRLRRDLARGQRRQRHRGQLHRH